MKIFRRHTFGQNPDSPLVLGYHCHLPCAFAPFAGSLSSPSSHFSARSPLSSSTIRTCTAVPQADGRRLGTHLHNRRQAPSSSPPPAGLQHTNSSLPMRDPAPFLCSSPPPLMALPFFLHQHPSSSSPPARTDATSAGDAAASGKERVLAPLLLFSTSEDDCESWRGGCSPRGGEEVGALPPLLFIRDPRVLPPLLAPRQPSLTPSPPGFSAPR